MPESEQPNQIWLATKLFSNTILYQCVGVIFIYSIWIPIASGYSVPFSWHVILATLGMIPFMVESLLLFSSDSAWSQNLTRKQKYWIHGILISIGTFFFTLGNGLEIYRRVGVELKNPKKKHFQSIHAITGLISMILIILAFVCGFAAFNSNMLKQFAAPVWFKFIHNILGQLGYIIGLISLICGFYTSWFQFYTSEASRIAATVVTVIITIWSVKGAIQSAYHQIKSIKS